MENQKPPIWTKDFALVLLLAASTMLTFQLLLPTLPRFVVQVGGGTPQVGLSLAIFSVAALATRILGGWMVDRYGQKLPLLIGSCLFIVAAPLYELTTELGPFLALRALHGLGFGFLTNAMYSLGADLAPPARRGEALGHVSNAVTLSAAIGPALASALLGVTAFMLTGFQMIFALCTIVAVVGFGAALTVRETRSAHVATGRRSAGIVNLPTLPLAGVSLLVQFAAGGVLSFAPLYLSVRILPAFYLSYALAIIVSRPYIGRLSDRMDRRRLVVPILLVAAVGVGILALGTSLPIVVASAVLFGIGHGAFTPIATAIVVDRTPPLDRGRALATFTSSIDIGIAAGSIALGLAAVSFGLSAVFMGASISIFLGLLCFAVLQSRLAPPQTVS